MSKTLQHQQRLMLLFAAVLFGFHIESAGAQIAPATPMPGDAAPLISQQNTASGDNTADTTQADNAPSSDPDFSPSFREEIGSMLYQPEQVADLKIALERIERVLAQGGAPAQEIIEASNAADTNLRPTFIPDLRFPAYHIASIAYRSPQDWMIWINGQRVTPKRKYTGLQVAYVGPESVQLIWKPDEWKYRLGIWQSSKDISKDLSKIASRQGATYVDKVNNRLVATLRPNQTWVTATPLIVEGQHTEFAVTIKPDPQSVSPDKAFSADAMKKLLTEKAKSLGSKPSQNTKSDEAKSQPGNTLPNTAASSVPPTGTAPSNQQAIPGLPTSAPKSFNDFLDSVGSPVPSAAPAALAAPVAPSTATLPPSPIQSPVNTLPGGLPTR